MIQNTPITWQVLFIVFFGLLIHTRANAQRDFNYKFISKVVAGDSTVTPITNCHIVNTTQHIGTVSGEYGNFTITANLKDSIKFSAIGFEDLTIVVSDSMYRNDRTIRMTPKVYALGEVNIGLFSTYGRFKHDVMDVSTVPGYKMDPMISKFEIQTRPLPNQGGVNVPGLGSPVSFMYNLLSKEGKQQRNYLSVINKTAKHIVIGEKFNGEIVGRLTGLKDDELVNFMSSCLFTSEYLLQASQEEINRMVIRKYKSYIAKNNEHTNKADATQQ